MDTLSKADTASSTRILSEFLASVRYENLPPVVVARTEELFLDWLASALAGRGARPTRIMEQFAGEMGPGRRCQ
jgi:2-methylcitrate dehydratase PrpD